MKQPWSVGRRTLWRVYFFLKRKEKYRDSNAKGRILCVMRNKDMFNSLLKDLDQMDAGTRFKLLAAIVGSSNQSVQT